VTFTTAQIFLVHNFTSALSVVQISKAMICKYMRDLDPSHRSPLPQLTFLCTAMACIVSSCSPVAKAPTASPNGSLFPDTTPDPLERINRGVWAANRGILVGVMQPSSRVYRKVVPQPARRSVTHFARNITYPGRLVNHALQGRWDGAGSESLRFLTNTTVGVGGLFDVASQWKIKKSEADFGQTFYGWGWKPSTYLMLPFLGPSDDTRLFGLAADKAVEPWTYIPESFPVAAGLTYNEIAHRTEQASRFYQSETDAYAGAKYIWTYAKKEEAPDWRTYGPIDPSTLQTLGVISSTCEDPDFPERGKKLSVRIPSTGRKMYCNYWIQAHQAPLVYIAPGLSSHRLSPQILAQAESLFNNGFSVVTTTGVFHPEFMENASTAKLPAYPPVDCQDLLVEYTEFDRQLEKMFPNRLGKRALVGLSMGGYQALYIAAVEKKTSTDLMRFDRYVAINSPVDLHYGVKEIDSFYKAPLAWSDQERQYRINNTLHKAAKLITLPPKPNSPPPFDAVESKYIVGLSFQLTLRDAIFSSQSRHNMGVLKSPLSKWQREESYQEILNYSFRDYFLKFAVPYYQTKGVTIQDFTREANLRSYESRLRAQKKAHVIFNQNDFLLPPRDATWFETTLGKSHVKSFRDGGHLGNLTSPAVQQALIKTLSDLK
jgi:ABC-type transporter lipoprotein component MlaA/pimeloyl-ACP methyl ester carboxylesterase